jgi:hypothetical protein
MWFAMNVVCHEWGFAMNVVCHECGLRHKLNKIEEQKVMGRLHDAARHT